MEGSDGASGEEHFEAVRSVLAFRTPVEDRVFPGQGMQRAGDGCKIFDLSTVITGETQERADFRGVFRRLDLLDGC